MFYALPKNLDCDSATHLRKTSFEIHGVAFCSKEASRILGHQTGLAANTASLGCSGEI